MPTMHEGLSSSLLLGLGVSPDCGVEVTEAMPSVDAVGWKDTSGLSASVVDGWSLASGPVG